ncbi:Arginine deiminase [Mycoplasmopsis meleagridis]|uniref:Arginine deiminase n=1 Tax=Mycoplasmopsis meleagridis ATCC 25294 TaxID=1264554 RepID=A0A0F5H212_9BACT|nr:arginine deiminase family protein [Mycoplasmopsis meleagridis]KKB26882.1 Arginine deiminase [Mycoplasmopsis meleagridis ATCC 25294]OAD18289.1 Arginine deiminase [Mycoplasmopsis meleagridis]VEU77538.1 arginine deiminase domain-containing protein [Mycoplasmopsis meleagridis]
MSKINVYSEIGVLKEVLVHTPGDEIRRISPSRLDELLFSAILQPEQAIKEHQSFVKILQDRGIKVIQLSDLVAETYVKYATSKEKESFIEKWLDEATPALNSENRARVKNYITAMQGQPVKMVRAMMAGVSKQELNIESDVELIVDPMPNLYFTRDPFASAGNGISLNNMKYVVRKRETIFAEFIFSIHPEYKQTPHWFDRLDKGNIEGGDVFIYNKDTLVIGVSERTNKEAILTIAEHIKNNKEAKFKKIVAINVPPMPNLMHLDTWLTMVDKNKFLYSPNMLSVLKIWEIDLSKEIKMVETSKPLADVLESIIGEKPILIPIAGENASQLDIDIETHFDGTNYLTIAPGVVVGYSRNVKTEAALKAAGVTVYSFDGNQLSLGMGSGRCMSMPLVREDVK